MVWPWTEIQELRDEIKETIKEHNKVVGYATIWMKRAQLAEAKLKEKTNTQFNQEQLRKIRVLCHPDKHNSSLIALEITKVLNTLIKP